MNLQQLIDKRDNFEIIRDQIAAILANECVNQQAKALEVDPPQDPALYALNIFMERSAPWEDFFSDNPDYTPIVNVWYNNSDFDGAASSVVERQKTVGIFNIDVYGAANSAATVDGHVSGDELAARNAQRALRLVRNILMASINTYLQLRGLVWQRWPQAVNMFQPQADTRPVNAVVAGRLALRVTFNEFSPQYEPEELEYVALVVKQKANGQVIANTDYDYTI